MANKAKTTETLRKTLFDVMDGVVDGTMDIKQAKTACDVAGRIIETADLEITVAKTYASFDDRGVDISIGAHLLANPVLGHDKESEVE